MFVCDFLIDFSHQNMAEFIRAAFSLIIPSNSVRETQIIFHCLERLKRFLTILICKKISWIMIV